MYVDIWIILEQFITKESLLFMKPEDLESVLKAIELPGVRCAVLAALSKAINELKLEVSITVL